GVAPPGSVFVAESTKRATEAAIVYEDMGPKQLKGIPDGDERQRVMPRLAHLVCFEDRAASNPQDLFSAWRRFFEGLAEHSPTVMIFEDLHWADAALLDFINHLMDWSRNYRLFVLTLARPELAERHPGWGARRPTFTQLHLDPLPASAMEKLLAGLVPGLPSHLRSRILERAEGVPLYAVETVRMLLDRGLLVQEGSAYRPTGRSGPWTCRRPCRPSSASASTASTPTSVRSCRTPPSWEGPSRSPPWRRSPDVPRPISSPCSPA
ncbi:MAG TPA: hypothetical protein VII47_12975, partial [Actinomycetota bacterium]